MQEAFHAVHKHNNRKSDCPKNWPHNESWKNGSDDYLEVVGTCTPSSEVED